MTPEAQIIAIAEWCGLTAYDERSDYGFNSKTGIACVIPDYLNDLNAVAVARRKLNVSQKAIFDYHLDCIASRDSNALLYYTWDTSANQQVEALLRTIGKYED